MQTKLQSVRWKLRVSAFAFALILTALYSARAAAQTNTFPASGNVGVGTTSPSQVLHVEKDQNTNSMVLVQNATAGSAAQADVRLLNDSGKIGQFGIYSSLTTTLGVAAANDVHLYSSTNLALMADGATGLLKFSTGGTAEKMRLDASGNLGIGTTNPVQRLSVAVNDAVTNSVTHVLSIGHNTTGTPAAGLGSSLNFQVERSDGSMGHAGYIGGIWEDPTNGTEDGALIFAPVLNSTGYGTERMRITSGGNVGIGTTNPSYKLQVVSANGQSLLGDPTGNQFFLQIRPHAGKQGWMTFTEDNVADRWAIGIRSNDARFYFSTGNVGSLTDRMVIDAAGNLGIGTISPTSKLDVAGNGHLTGNLTVDGNIAAKYQDVAEWVPASRALPPGTVVSLDPSKSNHVIASAEAYDTRVAGVVSEQPGITLGERGENKLLVATTGRVSVIVDAASGPIRVGDLLVTSDLEGVAMKSVPVKVGKRQMHLPGTLIGKALEPLAQGRGKILVLLSLQ